MRFFWDVTALTCKRLLRRPGVLFITLLLPLVCAAAGLYLAGEGEVLEMRVGVALEPGDDFSERIYAELSRFEGPVAFERHSPGNRDYLEREVAAGRMEAAYLIPPGLDETMRGGRIMGNIEVLTSPRAVLDGLAGEIILASMLREASPQMNIELIARILRLPPEQAEEIVAELYAYYNAREYIFLEPVFVYHAAGEADGILPLPVEARALHGIIALFLLAGVIWALPTLARETPGILRKLPPGGNRVFMLGTAFALTLTGLLQGVFGLAAIALTHPAAISSLPVSAIMLAAYLLCLGLGGSAAVLLAPCPGAVYPAGIFILIFTAALGGPLIDPGEVSPRLAVIPTIFPSWYYIGGALGGTLQPLPVLLVFSLVFAFAGLTMLAARK
ncbi:MAG: ABC transporter permease [Oscillospiraceae bacterium]|nr:ABC transporter permease [Oscillospiraceae bacterium]